MDTADQPDDVDILAALDRLNHALDADELTAIGAHCIARIARGHIDATRDPDTPTTRRATETPRPTPGPTPGRAHHPDEGARSRRNDRQPPDPSQGSRACAPQNEREE